MNGEKEIKTNACIIYKIFKDSSEIFLEESLINIGILLYCRFCIFKKCTENRSINFFLIMPSNVNYVLHMNNIKRNNMVKYQLEILLNSFYTIF